MTLLPSVCSRLAILRDALCQPSVISGVLIRVVSIFVDDGLALKMLVLEMGGCWKLLMMHDFLMLCLLFLYLHLHCLLKGST